MSRKELVIHTLMMLPICLFVVFVVMSMPQPTKAQVVHINQLHNSK